MNDVNIKIPVNKKRFPGLLIASALITIVVMMVLHFGSDVGSGDELTMRVIDSLILVTPLFYTSAALVDYLKTRFDDDTALFITSRGIDDNLSVFSCGQIKWSEIAGIESARYLNIDVIIIKLADPMEVARRQGLLKRWILMRRIRMGRSPMIIAQTKIDYNISDLKNILTSHIAQ